MPKEKLDIAGRGAGPLPVITTDIDLAMQWLRRHSSKATRAGMARFGLPSEHAIGVTMADLQGYSKQIGKDHQLALDLWATGVYEARLLAALIDDPALVKVGQMDRWCRDFDNWGICDTVCFALFDRTPFAWKKVAQWHNRKEEFVKRGAFALLWGLTVHDKSATNAQFVECVPFIEAAATDERHLVKKAVNMALRAMGKRNAVLHAAAVKVSRKLAASEEATPRWIGKDALRELSSASVLKRIATR